MKSAVSRLTLAGVLAAWTLGAAPPVSGQPAAAAAMSNPSGADALAPWQGRVVRVIDLEGNRVTRESVIRREIRTAVGRPLDLDTLREDYLRLENLEIFSAVRVEAEDADADGVRLRLVLKESNSWLPLVAFTYTEENGSRRAPGSRPWT